MQKKILLIILTGALVGSGILSLSYWQARGELMSQTQKVETLLNQIDIHRTTISELQEQIKELKTQTSEHSTKIDASDWKVYRNDEYGFELTFPERWEDYKVGEEVSEGLAAVAFKLKHTRHGKYHIVFTIGVYPKEKWEQLQSEEGPSVGTYLGGQGGYVFDYSMGHDDEGYIGFPKITPGEIYHGPFYDVKNKIIPTFRFIKIDQIAP